MNQPPCFYEQEGKQREGGRRGKGGNERERESIISSHSDLARQRVANTARSHVTSIERVRSGKWTTRCCNFTQHFLFSCPCSIRVQSELSTLRRSIRVGGNNCAKPNTLIFQRRFAFPSILWANTNRLPRNTKGSVTGRLTGELRCIM